MLKVLRSIRVINKMKREEKYKQFSAIAHHEVIILTKVFRGWKNAIVEDKQRVEKERNRIMEINFNMDLAKKKIYYRKLKRNMILSKETKEKYRKAIDFNNYYIAKRGF